jgi:hypothetical protein
MSALLTALGARVCLGKLFILSIESQAFAWDFFSGIASFLRSLQVKGYRNNGPPI